MGELVQVSNPHKRVQPEVLAAPDCGMALLLQMLGSTPWHAPAANTGLHQGPPQDTTHGLARLESNGHGDMHVLNRQRTQQLAEQGAGSPKQAGAWCAALTRVWHAGLQQGEAQAPQNARHQGWRARPQCLDCGQQAHVL